MRILFVAPVFPLPPNTGTRILALHHVRGLAARGHEVDLVCLGQGDEAPLRALCRRVVCVPAPARTPSMARSAAGLLRGTPWEVSRFHSRAMLDAVEAVVAGGDHDAGIFQLSLTLQYRTPGFRAPALLALEDPIVVKHLRMAQQASPLRRPWFLAGASLMRRYESARVPRFDRVMIINRTDLEDCRALYPDARFEWVPYGVDVSAFPSAPLAGREPGTIIITGNMYHPPNARAVVHFCDHVLPRVRVRVPQARLRVVGAGPSRAVLRRGQHPGVEVTGPVPEVAPHLRRAMVSVCAVDLRVGTQTKILEAMASGTPVVTTSAGNHGIEATDGVHLHVADDPARFADRVSDLLELRGWEPMAAAARAFVEQRFDWPVGMGRLDEVLHEMVAERRARRG